MRCRDTSHFLLEKENNILYNAINVRGGCDVIMDVINNKAVIEIIKTAILSVCIYWTNFKILNLKFKWSLLELLKILCVIGLSRICYIIGDKTIFLAQIILLIICISKVFSWHNSKNSIMVTVFSVVINYSILLVSIVIDFALKKTVRINNDLVNLCIIIILNIVMLIHFTNIKKFKYGLAFFRENKQNDYIDLMALNFGVVFLSVMIMAVQGDFKITKKFFPVMVIDIIMLVIVIRKMLQLYYKQKITKSEMQQLKEEVEAKDKEIKKLEQENLNFSKKSHSLAHKQKSLEYKLNQLLLNSEISEEQDLKNQLEQISTDLYSKPVIDLAKTEITKIDDMLKFMQSECIKNNIDFNLQITGNVYYIINNLITEDQLEILIADHIKDAIIAIKHTDNINKSILVRLGKIDDIYGLYIYDSGVEFEKETLNNLGKKPSTTHADEGGTGMGFMNTFDTLKKCKASLVIDEIGKPSKENFTKVIMIKFDGKDEFRVESYRK